MTDREHEILKILKKEPLISHDEIAQRLFITRSTVSVHITNLIEKGYVKGRGYIFNDDYIVCIGSANVDITGYATSPIKAKDKNPNANIEITVGGVARNIGENLARMGTKVYMLTAVGDDVYGELIKSESAKCGIETDDFLTVSGGKSCIYMSVNGPDKDLAVGLTDMHLTSYIDEKYLKTKEELLNRATAIVVSPCVTESGLSYLRKNHKEKPIFVDVAAIDYCEKVLAYIDIFHTIKANEHEIEYLTGVKITDNNSLEKAANKLISNGVTNVYITLGGDGVYYKNNKGVTLRKKAYDLGEIVSSIGAGDAFTAGIIYSYLNRYDENKSVKYASVSASFTLLTAQAINKEISSEKILEKVREI